MIIKEENSLSGFKKAGYAFKIRTMSSGYIDLFCYSDKRTCQKYYNAFEDVIDYFNSGIEEDEDVLNDRYANEIQDVYEMAQHYASDFYEEIDYRHDIIVRTVEDVYLDRFADKYYIIINDIALDI